MQQSSPYLSYFVYAVDGVQNDGAVSSCAQVRNEIDPILVTYRWFPTHIYHQWASRKHEEAHLHHRRHKIGYHRIENLCRFMTQTSCQNTQVINHNPSPSPNVHILHAVLMDMHRHFLEHDHRSMMMRSGVSYYTYQERSALQLFTALAGTNI